MRYAIIATLGPVTHDTVSWDELLSAGASCFRLNTSHLTISELTAWLERLENYLQPGETSLTVTLDLQGSKWRLGDVPNRCLITGDPLKLVYGSINQDAEILPVPHSDFFQAVSISSGQIVLNDARVVLTVEKFGPDWIETRVIRGGQIAARKGITYSSSSHRQEDLNPKDRQIVDLTRGLNYVRYAISYIKDAVEMRNYRGIFGSQTYLAAKLERADAMEQAFEIASLADEMWLCRGDLGAEMGLPGMAQASYKLSSRVKEIPVPVYLAGQVLEHMTDSPSPTRSEVCSLYTALMDGYYGFVLSDETAIGKYPEDSCRAAAMFR